LRAVFYLLLDSVLLLGRLASFWRIYEHLYLNFSFVYLLIDKNKVSHKQIRRVSIDKFYEIVTGDRLAFKKLCTVLPRIIEDVVSSVKLAEKSNTVVKELKEIDKNLLKSIYLLSFRKYEGFHEFDI
jgi:hypothetical protein